MYDVFSWTLRRVVSCDPTFCGDPDVQEVQWGTGILGLTTKVLDDVFVLSHTLTLTGIGDAKKGIDRGCGVCLRFTHKLKQFVEQVPDV